MTNPAYQQDEAMDSYTIRLTARHARIARRLGGNGNLSRGVRKAIEQAEDSVDNLSEFGKLVYGFFNLIRQRG